MAESESDRRLASVSEEAISNQQLQTCAKEGMIILHVIQQQCVL